MTISKAALEAFIDERLEEMRQRPLMWGPPVAIECECFLLIELFEKFCREEDIPRAIETSGALFTAFARKHLPKKPSAALLSTWFTDKVWGCATAETDDHWAAQRIVEFFIAWKAELKA